jgi:hypothetical protein
MNSNVVSAPSLPSNMKRDRFLESQFNAKGFYGTLNERLEANQVHLFNRTICLIYKKNASSSFSHRCPIIFNTNIMHVINFYVIAS